MKTNTNILNKITNNHNNTVGVKLFGEWNLNNFYRTVNDNTPTEDSAGFDVEYFPIESITTSHRPTAGICKAVVNQSFVEATYHLGKPAQRFYLASQDDQYKYWQSPVTSGITLAGGGYDIASTAPQVTYVAELDVSGSPVPITVNTNKIRFTVENGYAQPVTYDVQVKATSASAWTTVASNTAIAADGTVRLWYNGSTWTTTPDYTHFTTMYAVRLVINKMNLPTSYFNLIELGFALELDMSADVISVDDGQTMGEVDFISPLGNISSNSGSITLYSETDFYTKENASSPLFGMLDRGVKLTLFYVYDGVDSIQEFEMFSDTWTQGEDLNVDVQITDDSKFLQDTKPRPTLYENIPVQEAVWRICDIIGFNKYAVTTIATTADAVIDIFWSDGQKSAWDLFGELARATQTAIYFDSFGYLQIKTRDAAWDATKSVSQSFIRNSVPGGQPSNIASLSESTAYEATRVTVNWKPTGFSERVDNVIPFEVVWEPDGAVVLRSSPLQLSMTSSSTVIPLSQHDGENWPWKGMCQIDGEWIAYEGKNYIYYDASSARQSKIVKDLATQQKLDASTPVNMRHLNHYTGFLTITDRGLYNTDPQAHQIDLNNWTKSREFRNAGSPTISSPCTGIGLNRDKSSVSINGPKRCGQNDFTYLHHGLKTDAGYYFMGVRMKIDRTSASDKVGGLAFCMDGTNLVGGYYLDVMAATKITGQLASVRQEVMLYSYKDDGTKQAFGGDIVTTPDHSKDHPQGATIKHNVGAGAATVMGSYVDFDIILNAAGDYIQIWCNGKFLFDATITAPWKHNRVGRMALYARGNSDVTFDYVYAITNGGINPTDSEGYYDRIDGAYRGQQWMNDWTYETRTVRRKVKKKWTKVKQKYNQRFFEEFGPMVHEIRQFKVKFTNDTPSLESKLLFSNTTLAVCTEYSSDIYNAQFLMANIGRFDAVINGDDELTAGGQGTITQHLYVYGRPVIQKDAMTVIKDDTFAQRRRGIIETTYDSDWIQNEAEANRFSDWLTTHWSKSDTTLSVEVFGNPLVELTDVVGLTFNNISGSFYVVGISNSFSAGLTTTLELREV